MSRNTFDRAKLAQQFVPANKRPSCRNCFHASETVAVGGAPLWQCMKGGFFTTALATCAQHQPFMPQTGAPV